MKCQILLLRSTKFVQTMILEYLTTIFMAQICNLVAVTILEECLNPFQKGVGVQESK